MALGIFFLFFFDSFPKFSMLWLAYFFLDSQFNISHAHQIHMERYDALQAAEGESRQKKTKKNDPPFLLWASNNKVLYTLCFSNFWLLLLFKLLSGRERDMVVFVLGLVCVCVCASCCSMFIRSVLIFFGVPQNSVIIIIIIISSFSFHHTHTQHNRCRGWRCRQRVHSYS